MATILLVEDDEAIRESLSEILSDNHNVVAMKNGLEALYYLKTSTPDLILLDLFMPVMHGCAFRKEQAKDERLCRIPVVMISAGKPECHPNYPIRGFLSKPFELDELLSTVSQQLKKGPLKDFELADGPLICRTCSVCTTC